MITRLIAIATAAMAAHASAALMVNFGGDVVTSSTAMLNSTGGTTSNANVNADAFNDATRTVAFTNQLLNLGATSARFYGGYQLTEFGNATLVPTAGSSSPNVDDWNIENITTPTAADRINFRVQLGNNITAGRYSGVFYWKKADFLNGGDTTNLASVQSIAATLVEKAPATRWLIEQGGQFYVSSAQLSANTANSIDPSTTTWAPFNLADINFDQAAATFSTLSVGNITSVGLYYEEDAQPTAARRLRVNAFSVNATLVPEPATLASLALAGLLGLRRRR